MQWNGRDRRILRARKNLETPGSAQLQKLQVPRPLAVPRGYNPANNSPKATRTPGTLAQSRTSLPV